MPAKPISNDVTVPDQPFPDTLSLPDYASVPTTAAFLQLSEATVWRRIADGTLLTVKIGGTRRVLLRRSLAALGTGDC